MSKNHKMAQGTGSAAGGKAAKPAAQDVAAQLDLKPGQSIELLKALHILTRDGKLTTTPDATCSTHLLYHGQESGQIVGAAVHPMELGEVYLKKANI